MADVLDETEVYVAGIAPRPVPVPDDDVRSQVVDGVRIDLEGDAHVGETSDFSLRFADAATGDPVDDLQPYLGAAGHVVVMRSDGSMFGHRHAETDDSQGRPVFALPGTSFGPELDLHVTFQVPGAYRLWAQFELARRDRGHRSVRGARPLSIATSSAVGATVATYGFSASSGAAGRLLTSSVCRQTPVRTRKPHDVRRAAGRRLTRCWRAPARRGRGGPSPRGSAR